MSEIHDLLALRVMVDNINDCYQTLGVIHSKYRPLNDKFKESLERNFKVFQRIII